MQSARHLIGIVVGRVLELAASVQLGHDDLCGGNALFLMHAGWNAAAIIFDRNRTIGVQFDQHKVTMSGQRLVNGIVGNFEHHVVQAATVIRVANIHAGALTNRVEALQNLDAVCTIFILIGVGCAVRRGVKLRGFRCFFSHPRTVGPKPKKPKEKRPKIDVFPQSFVVGDTRNLNLGVAFEN